MTLLFWASLGPWRGHPGRAAVAVAAIAIGVALGLSIHLVNRSALQEFSRAIAVVNGDAQLRVSAAAGSVDEALYATLATDRRVAAASPVVEIQSAVIAPGDGGTHRMLRLVGLDAFRAAQVTPGLLPLAQGDRGSASRLFADDAVFLSEAAIQQLGARPGERIRLRVGVHDAQLLVSGTVPGAAAGQALGVVDLGTLQWRFGWIGRLSRIDLRLADGADPNALEADVRAASAGTAVVTTPDAAEQRMSNLSRAYRVNLNVLALVALFTGGFIVYSTMLLAIARQLPSLALLGILGAGRRKIGAIVLLQGVLIGTIGAIAGLALGVALAQGMLGVFGGDLGGGYFGSSTPRLDFGGASLPGFALLGIAAGLGGSIVPALRLARIEPMRALRAGPLALEATATRGLAWPLAWALVGGLLALAPPLLGLPLPAYAAIAAWLFCGISLIPSLTAAAMRGAVALEATAWRSPAAWLALRRLGATPGAGAAALAGVVASFALASAMVIMVASFRDSVQHWLEQVLPADIYGRAPAASGNAGLTPPIQQALQSLPGVARLELMRTLELDLRTDRPAVVLLARTIDRQAPQTRLPLTGAQHSVPGDAIPVWISEPMADLYGLAAGAPLSLPLGPNGTRFEVAGIWRDYARQHGAVAMALDDYRRLTGDPTVNEFSIWLRSPDDEREVREAIGRPDSALAALETRSAGELKALSLRIFDRSFALTYVLEALAIVVGLIGASATFAGDALARARELALLQHLGAVRSRIATQLAIESAALLACGVCWGAFVGAAIAVLLVHRVNPQSFHWTMQMSWPLGLLVTSGTALAVLGTLASALGARRATSASPVGLLREDW